ncbi:MAG: hypothetical protein JWM04_2811 [Verrucomicrobiales bacterium]|nr:hypothetical protein [Verrucomicrobiales bacterium]
MTTGGTYGGEGGDQIYITGPDGVTVVLKHNRKNEPLAVNKLEDSFSASATVEGRELLLRGERFFYCLAEANKQ